MNARLAFEVSEGHWSFDENRGTVDPSFLIVAAIEKFNLIVKPLSPTRVHPE